MQNDQEKDQNICFQQIGQNKKILEIENKKINQLQSLKKEHIFKFTLSNGTESIYIVQNKQKIDNCFKELYKFIKQRDIQQDINRQMVSDTTYFLQSSDDISQKRMEVKKLFKSILQMQNAQPSVQFSGQIMLLHIAVNLIKVLMQKIMQGNSQLIQQLKKTQNYSFFIDQNNNFLILNNQQQQSYYLLQDSQQLQNCQTQAGSSMQENEQKLVQCSLIIKSFIQYFMKQLDKNNKFKDFIRINLNQYGHVLIKTNLKLGQGTYGQITKGFLFTIQQNILIIKNCVCKKPKLYEHIHNLFNETSFYLFMQILKQKLNKLKRFFVQIPSFYGIFQFQKLPVLCIELCQSSLQIQKLRFTDNIKFYNFVKNIAQGLYSMHYLQNIINFAIKKGIITQDLIQDIKQEIEQKLRLIFQKIQKINQTVKQQHFEAQLQNLLSFFQLKQGQHIKGFIHCDFKRQNLLYVNQKQFLHSKICDFGSIIFLQTQQLTKIELNSTKIASTLYYRASQLIKSQKTKKINNFIQNEKQFNQNQIDKKPNQNQKDPDKNKIIFNSKIDIWAFGITILQFFLKKNAFQIYSFAENPGVIKRSHKFLFKNKSQYIQWGDISQNIKKFWEELMANCLKQDIKERWTSQILLKYINNKIQLFYNWNFIKDNKNQLVQIIKYTSNQRTIQYHLNKNKLKQLKNGIKICNYVKKIQIDTTAKSQSYCSLIQFYEKKQFKKFMKGINENIQYSKMIKFKKQKHQFMEKNYVQMNFFDFGLSLKNVIKECHSDIQILQLISKILQFLNQLSWLSNFTEKGFLLLILNENSTNQNSNIFLDLNIFINSQFYQLKKKSQSQNQNQNKNLKIKILMVKIANQILDAYQGDIVSEKDLQQYFELLKKYENIPDNIIIEDQINQFIKQKRQKYEKLVNSINQKRGQIQLYLRVFELQIMKIRVILNTYQYSKYMLSIIQYSYFLTQVYFKTRKILCFAMLQQKTLSQKELSLTSNALKLSNQHKKRQLNMISLKSYFEQNYFKLHPSQSQHAFQKIQENSIQNQIEKIHQILIKIKNYQNKFTFKKIIISEIDIKLQKMQFIIDHLLSHQNT